MSRISTPVSLNTQNRELDTVSQNLATLVRQLQAIVDGRQIIRDGGIYSANSPMSTVSAGVTSASYADMPTVSLVIRDLVPGNIIEFEGATYLYNSTSLAVVYVKMMVNDGQDKSPNNLNELTLTSDGAHPLLVSFVHRFTVVTAGVHTLKFQVKTSSGTAQFRDFATIRARILEAW